jgi:DNA polymerase
VTVTITEKRRLKTREHRLADEYAGYAENASFEHLRYGSHFVPGVGTSNPLVMFVAGLPTPEEAKAGRNLVGRERIVLLEALKTIDLKTEHVFYTNILKYRPSQGRDPRPSEEMASLPYLWREMDILKPKVVIPLGRYATSCFFDGYPFSEVRGIPSTDGEHNYVAMHSFTTILMNPKLRTDLVDDMQAVATYL